MVIWDLDIYDVKMAVKQNQKQSLLLLLPVSSPSFFPLVSFVILLRIWAWELGLDTLGECSTVEEHHNLNLR